MDTKNLSDVAKKLQDKAQDLLNNPKVQEAVNKGKEWIQSEEGKKAVESAKDKVEDFISDKTNGKGIFGFGSKTDAKK